MTDAQGKEHPLHSSIGPQKGEFIWELVESHNIRHSLEIGCAFGIASLFICDALSRKPGARHLIIDPFQSTLWHGAGVHSLDKAGYDFYELTEKPSELALPVLLKNPQRFDFALIDGMHRFEHVMLDFFYVNNLLNVGGIVVFDDLDTPSVNKALRFIINYPHYEVAGVCPKQQQLSFKRKLLDGVKKTIRVAIKPLPERVAREVFADSVFLSKNDSLLNRGSIALRKTAPDTRHWAWYQDF